MDNVPINDNKPAVKAFIRRRTHGLSQTRLYQTWCGMMHRCYNSRCFSFPTYGGRGISVCERWHDVKNFHSDMASSFHEGLTLDRINPNGNYEPENCRWADILTQANNRRNNRFIAIDGVSKTISQWCRQHDIFPQVFANRVESGMSHKQALETPILKAKMVSHAGKSMTVREWSKETGLTRFVIHARLNLGWTPEETLTTPRLKIRR